MNNQLQNIITDNVKTIEQLVSNRFLFLINSIQGKKTYCLSVTKAKIQDLKDCWYRLICDNEEKEPVDF